MSKDKEKRHWIRKNGRIISVRSSHPHFRVFKTVNGIILKKCSRCGQWLDLSTRFQHDSHGPRHYRSDCRTCYAASRGRTPRDRGNRRIHSNSPLPSEVFDNEWRRVHIRPPEAPVVPVVAITPAPSTPGVCDNTQPTVLPMVAPLTPSVLDPILDQEGHICTGFSSGSPT